MLRAEQDPANAVSDAHGLLRPIGLDREAVDELPPSPALLVDGNELRRRAHLRTREHWRRKSDAVPTHVDPQRDFFQIKGVFAGELLAKAVDDAQRQVAVCDRGAERRLAPGPLNI